MSQSETKSIYITCTQNLRTVFKGTMRQDYQLTYWASGFPKQRYWGDPLQINIYHTYTTTAVKLYSKVQWGKNKSWPTQLQVFPSQSIRVTRLNSSDPLLILSIFHRRLAIKEHHWFLPPLSLCAIHLVWGCCYTMENYLIWCQRWWLWWIIYCVQQRWLEGCCWVIAWKKVNGLGFPGDGQFHIWRWWRWWRLWWWWWYSADEGYVMTNNDDQRNLSKVCEINVNYGGWWL